MNTPPEIKLSVKELDGDDATYKISGSNVTPLIINTLRQVIMKELPAYGIYRSGINITKVPATIDADGLRAMLMMLPVKKITPKVNFLAVKYYPYVSGNYGSIKPDSHKEIKHDPLDDIKLEYVINIAHTGRQKMLDVTTNDIKIYQDDKEIKNPYDREQPILITRLKRGETFKCQILPNLGIPRLHNCWSSVGTCYFKELAENDYEFVIESLGGMMPDVILDRTCDNIIHKLNFYLQKITEKSDQKNVDTKLTLNLDDEDHTFGAIMTEAFQLHPKVIRAGYLMDHPQVRQIKIDIETKQVNCIKVISEALNYLISVYQKLKQQIKKKRSKVVIEDTEEQNEEVVSERVTDLSAHVTKKSSKKKSNKRISPKRSRSHKSH